MSERTASPDRRRSSLRRSSAQSSGKGQSPRKGRNTSSRSTGEAVHVGGASSDYSQVTSFTVDGAEDQTMFGANADDAAGPSYSSTEYSHQAFHDPSGYIKGLLDDAGIDDQDIDYGAIRQELEGPSMMSGVSAVAPEEDVEDAEEERLSRNAYAQRTTISVPSEFGEASPTDVPETASEPAAVVTSSSFLPEAPEESASRVTREWTTLQAPSEPLLQNSRNTTTTLSALSSSLEMHGLPALPPALLQSQSISELRSLTQLQAMVQSLVLALQASVKKHEEQTVLIEELTNTETSALRRKTSTMPMTAPSPPAPIHTGYAAAPPAAQRTTRNDNQHIRNLEDQIETLRTTNQNLVHALRDSNREREHLHTQLANQTALVDSFQSEMDQLRRVLAAKDAEQKERKARAEGMVAAIREALGEQPTQWTMKRPSLWKEAKTAETLAAEIAEVYEEKIKLLQVQVEGLQREVQRRGTGGSGGSASVRVQTGSSQREEEENGNVLVLQPGTKTSMVQQTEEHSGADHVAAKTGSAVSEQPNARIKELIEMEELRAQLEALTAAYEDLQEEKALMELELLSTQPGSEALQRRTKSGHSSDNHNSGKPLSTKELVKRDKIAHRMRMKQMEGMSEKECQNLLKEMCVKLNVDNIHRLVSHLDDIAKTILLIPQMQTYIKSVDAIVWSKVLSEQGEAHLSSSPRRKHPHKLADTLTTLESWRRIVEKHRRPDSRQSETSSLLHADQDSAAQKTTKRPPTMKSFENILGQVNEDERLWEDQKSWMEESHGRKKSVS